jgi:hypothetical protein
MDSGDGAGSASMENKMNRTAYINENRAYLRDMADFLEALTDEQFDAVAAATEEMGNADPGIDNHLVKTQELLDDFEVNRSQHWNERGSMDHVTVNGRPAILFENFQLSKGQPRKSQMMIVDMGDFRVAVQ